VRPTPFGSALVYSSRPTMPHPRALLPPEVGAAPSPVLLPSNDGIGFFRLAGSLPTAKLIAATAIHAARTCWLRPA